MKWIAFLLLLIGTQTLAQTFEVMSFPDSLVIRDENITVNPFSFGDHPLKELLKHKPKVKKELFENNHVEDKIDTIYYLTFAQAKFSVFKSDEESTWLLSADIFTAQFKTRLGIRVGQTKIEVMKLLNKYNLKTLPDCLVLENNELYEFFVIRFKKGVISSIEFNGYFD